MQIQSIKSAEHSRNQGLLEMTRRNIPAAVAHFRAAVAADAKDHVSLYNLGDIFANGGDPKNAIECLMRAVLAAPDVRVYKQRFLGVSIAQSFSAYSPMLSEAVRLCLASPDVDCSRAHLLWYNMFTLRPDFAALYPLVTKGGEAFFDEKSFAKIQDYTALLDPYFLDGIRRIVVYTVPVFESFMTALRRNLLEELAVPGKKLKSDDQLVTLASALSHYSFFTEYIFDVTEDDSKKIAELRRRIEAGQASEAETAIYACYAPLYMLDCAGSLEKKKHSDDLAGVVAAQVTDYRLLQERKKNISAVTEIGAGTSSAVRAQYEEFPFPRWKTFPMPPAFDRDVKKYIEGKGKKILIAGCGTGKDALWHAAAFPDAEVLAVDLSLSSLSYAIGKSEELEIKNITFRHGDILKLGSIGQTFDYIVCGGVLHHMKEPVAGWQVLHGLLKPGGIMQIGLYSRAARQDIIRAREIIQNEGFGNDAESMRRFRKLSPQLLRREDLATLMARRDYFHLSAYRDYLFHVQEHDFSIPEIADILKKLDLTFIKFHVMGNFLAPYRKEYPADVLCSNLDNWEAFEKKNPATFRGMYQFFCRKAG